MVKHVVRPKICELLRLRESRKSQCFQGVSAFFKILDLKSVVCTRNWRDTTFATPRNNIICLPDFSTRNWRASRLLLCRIASCGQAALALLATRDIAAVKTTLSRFRLVSLLKHSRIVSHGKPYLLCSLFLRIRNDKNNT